jgi:HAD superfamily hydrolase (TIGR01509 family)
MPITLIVFDLDGVLIDSRDLHYGALNRALSELAPDFVISREDHAATYDGLPTSQKLQKLVEKGLPAKLRAEIVKRKQHYTAAALDQTVQRDERLIGVFKTLKAKGYKLHVASNAVRYTVDLILARTGLVRYVDYVLSNEDVNRPKPNPEVYLRCMIREGVGPKETLIVEDSSVGRRGVINSGAWLCAVNGPEDVSVEHILRSVPPAGER